MTFDTTWPNRTRSLNASLQTFSQATVPEVCVSMWDLFGNPVLTWTASMKMSASRHSASNSSYFSNGGLSGTVLAPYSNGSACFTSLALTDNIGVQYSLQYTISSSQLPAVYGDAALQPKPAVDGNGASIDATISDCDALPFTFFTTNRKCQCHQGAYLNGTANNCVLCPNGYYTDSYSASTCVPCSANSYSTAVDINSNRNSSSCSACPPLSVSAVGSFLLTNCSCITGSYASFTPGNTVLYQPGVSTSFVCLPCPDGATCSYGQAASGGAVNGAFPPLAQVDYYHLTGREDNYNALPSPDHTRFYPCIIGLCLEETQATFCALHLELTNGSSWDTPGFVRDQCHFLLEGAIGASGAYPLPVVNSSLNGSVVLASSTIPTDNCILGQTGRVCSWCIPGWTVQGYTCAPCPPGSSIASQPKGSLNSLISILGTIAGVAFTAYLLLPLFPDMLDMPRQLVKGTLRIAQRLLQMVLMQAKTRISVSIHGSATVKLDAAAKKASHLRNKKSVLTLAVALYGFFLEPIRLIIDNVQIISSFQSTIHVAWVRPQRRLLHFDSHALTRRPAQKLHRAHEPPVHIEPEYSDSAQHSVRDARHAFLYAVQRVFLLVHGLVCIHGDGVVGRPYLCSHPRLLRAACPKVQRNLALPVSVFL